MTQIDNTTPFSTGDYDFQEAHLLWHSYMQAGFYAVKGDKT